MSTVSPQASLEALIEELVNLIENLGTPINSAIKTASTTVIVNLQPQGGGTVALDLSPITHGAPEILFNLTLGGFLSFTLAFVNAPPAGPLAEFVIVVNAGASATLTWPANLKWPQGIVPALTDVGGKLDTFVVYTQDGGNTYCGFVIGQNQ